VHYCTTIAPESLSLYAPRIEFRDWGAERLLRRTSLEENKAGQAPLGQVMGLRRHPSSSAP
jgi:hypothetical protein